MSRPGSVCTGRELVVHSGTSRRESLRARTPPHLIPWREAVQSFSCTACVHRNRETSEPFKELVLPSAERRTYDSSSSPSLETSSVVELSPGGGILHMLLPDSCFVNMMYSCCLFFSVFFCFFLFSLFLSYFPYSIFDGPNPCSDFERFSYVNIL